MNFSESNQSAESSLSISVKMLCVFFCVLFVTKRVIFASVLFSPALVRASILPCLMQFYWALFAHNALSTSVDSEQRSKRDNHVRFILVTSWQELDCVPRLSAFVGCCSLCMLRSCPCVAFTVQCPELSTCVFSSISKLWVLCKGGEFLQNCTLALPFYPCCFVESLACNKSYLIILISVL